MYDNRTGDRLFTEEALAARLGSTNRQAVDGHMKGVREAEGDFLEYLRGKCKVDAGVVDLVWNTWCRDPYMSMSELTARVNADYDGEKPLNRANVRKALTELSGWTWLQQQQGCFLGQVAVDEKHITIAGVTWYLFVAVDCVTRCPLHLNFFPSN